MKKKNLDKEAIALILGLILIVFMVLIGPFLTIWSLNTLFPVLAIPYTFWTWLAAVLLGGGFCWAK